jgi:hypothetical protein
VLKRKLDPQAQEQLLFEERKWIADREKSKTDPIDAGLHLPESSIAGLVKHRIIALNYHTFANIQSRCATSGALEARLRNYRNCLAKNYAPSERLD